MSESGRAEPLALYGRGSKVYSVAFDSDIRHRRWKRHGEFFLVRRVARSLRRGV